MVADQERFATPRVVIGRVYTRGGDQGETSLVGGERVRKNCSRIAAYGAVDELNAFFGVARVGVDEALSSYPALAALAAILLRVQHELFNLGAILATPPAQVRADQARIRAAEVERLEQELDASRATLPTLRSFVLPGGSRIGAALHVCRTVCRRAERACVTLAGEATVEAEALAYLNRLGDACFVWGRWADQVQGVAETLWDPNQAASSTQGEPEVRGP
ncbi:MAG: cob(I)yrinic acid a,c-diamide adenosyltransferase [Proteobacteria bacterium]|nr:cob(I)yrinic acid a,c-diamide adenosyltransferase [Pseudomonadota bacterium]